MNLKHKLTSRKFWCAIIGFITPIVIANGGVYETLSQITALIMSGASLIAYIICEGLADCKKAAKGGVEL